MERRPELRWPELRKTTATRGRGRGGSGAVRLLGDGGSGAVPLLDRLRREQGHCYYSALLCSALCSKSTVAKNRPSQRRGPDAQRRRDGGPGLAPQPRQESTVLLHLRGGKFDSIDIQQRGGGTGGFLPLFLCLR